MRKAVYITFLIQLLILCFPVHPVICLPQDDAKDKTAYMKASPDSDTAKAGTIISLNLSFHLPKGASIIKPPVIKGLESFTVVDNHIYTDRIKIRLFASKPGLIKTGEISLYYLDNEGKKQSLIAEPVSIKVLSNLGDNPLKAQLKPIQGIIPTRSIFLKYWFWLLVLVVVPTVGFFLLRWYRIYRKRKLFLEYSDPPHIRAKKDIENLDSQRLFENGSAKEFYFRFSEIVKRYIENIRGFPAVEYTTEEITSRIDNEMDRQILPLLRDSDLVKFADNIPTAAEKKEGIAMAIRYIEQTAPVYEAKDNPEGKTGSNK